MQICTQTQSPSITVTIVIRFPHLITRLKVWMISLIWPQRNKRCLYSYIFNAIPINICIYTTDQMSVCFVKGLSCMDISRLSATNINWELNSLEQLIQVSVPEAWDCISNCRQMGSMNVIQLNSNSVERWKMLLSIFIGDDKETSSSLDEEVSWRWSLVTSTVRQADQHLKPFKVKVKVKLFLTAQFPSAKRDNYTRTEHMSNYFTVNQSVSLSDSSWFLTDCIGLMFQC